MPRDLNDPDGWRLSSLRKILLLRFRSLSWLGGVFCEYVPSCGLGERAGLDEGRGDPWVTAVDGHFDRDVRGKPWPRG